jgi:hypothetical protein
MSEIKKKVIFVDGRYDHDFVSDGVTHTLLYSNSEGWSAHVRGTIALELVDDGNGYKVNGVDERKRLNYSEVVYLNILLQLIQDYKLEIAEKTLINDNNNNNLKNDN